MHIISNGHIVIFDLFEAVGWVVAITPHHRRATRAARCGANITSRLRRFDGRIPRWNHQFSTPPGLFLVE